MSDELEFSLTEKEAEDIAVRILSTRMMRQIEEVAGNQTTIAKKLGVSRGYVSQLFSGDKILNLAKIHRIQRAFKVRVSLAIRPAKTVYVEYSKYRTEYSGASVETTKFSGQFVVANTEVAALVQHG